MSRHAVLQELCGPDDARFHDALVAGLGRIAAQHGRGVVADKSRRTTRSLDMLFSGESGMPTGKGLMDFLLADETALDELAALYGVTISRRVLAKGDDMQLVADTAALVSSLADCISDGQRDHTETLRVANHLRTLLPRLMAIVAEADQLRGIAA